MKKVLLGLFILGVIGGFFGYTQYNKTHKSLETTTADQTVDAVNLFSAYEADEAKANQTYNGKVVEVSGTIQDISTDESGLLKLTLNAENDFGGVICQMNKEKNYTAEQFKIDSEVTLRGDCSGYLMDVVLIRCVHIN